MNFDYLNLVNVKMMSKIVGVEKHRKHWVFLLTDTKQSTLLSVLPTILTNGFDTRGELRDEPRSTILSVGSFMISGCEITTSADWPIFGAMCRWWARNMVKETHHERPIKSECACRP